MTLSRREALAGMAMLGLMPVAHGMAMSHLALQSVAAADALIAELDRTSPEAK